MIGTRTLPVLTGRALSFAGGVVRELGNLPGVITR
jgi:hypothetical protein